MAKTQADIDAKVAEIFAIVRTSPTPISKLGEQTIALRQGGGWTATEIEKVSAEVMGLLIRYGWNKPTT